MTALPKRRWFRFGLRTMFVVVTVVAIPLAWIGYYTKWRNDRHAALNYFHPTAHFATFIEQPSWGLWWVNERAIPAMTVYVTKDEDRPRALDMQRLYPECQVRIVYGPAPVENSPFIIQSAPVELNR